jgi:subtilisin family serine protease
VSLFFSACGERESPVSPADESARAFSAEQLGNGGMNLPKISVGSGHDHDPPDGDDLTPIVPGKIVVSVTNHDYLELINETYGTTIDYYLEDCSYVVLSIPSGQDPHALCYVLESSGLCEVAEPIFVTESPESNQGTIPFYEGDHIFSDVFDQDAMARIGADEAHEFATGQGVIVAVLDTGVDATHPDLSESISNEGYDFLDEDAQPHDGADGIDQDQDGIADEGAGHGTHVAGIVHVVAPGATILPIRVLDSEGAGTSVAVARGIRYAMAHGARVINLSLGLNTTADVIKDAIHDARMDDVVVVASAGNRGIFDDEHFPANRSEVISVASTNEVELKADFSSYGTKVDLCAPGQNILSTYLNHGYAVWSGTSMSTPMVSGAAALRIELNPSSNVIQIIHDMENSSLQLDFEGYVYDGLMGEGRLDLAQLTQQ